MRILAFDMTAARLTVGVAHDGHRLGRWDAEATRGRGGAIDDLIDVALNHIGWERNVIEGLVVVTGPGSLTATRIGWATASGWALAADIPVTGWNAPTVQKKWWVDAQEAVKWQGRVSGRTDVACMIHHRGDEFYYYDLSSPAKTLEPTSITIGEWKPKLGNNTFVVGSGIIGYRDRWISSLGPEVIVVGDNEAIVGGDQLALWGEADFAEGRALNPLESPLDYGMPPQFRKTI